MRHVQLSFIHAATCLAIGCASTDKAGSDAAADPDADTSEMAADVDADDGDPAGDDGTDWDVPDEITPDAVEEEDVLDDPDALDLLDPPPADLADALADPDVTYDLPDLPVDSPWDTLPDTPYDTVTDSVFDPPFDTPWDPTADCPSGSCTDVSGREVCVGSSGYLSCPYDPTCYLVCICDAPGSWGICMMPCVCP